MTAQCFADTNILLYAASNHPADAKKKSIARELLTTADIGISAQVLQEFIAVAFSKKSLGITNPETKSTLEALLEFPVVPITAPIVMHSFELKDQYRISYWDAAIIAAAHELQCETIYSEDLNKGQIYAGVQVINPFA